MLRFLVIIGLVGLSGCAHQELRTACGMSSFQILDEENVQRAWDQRFPKGTTYEHLINEVPATKPEGDFFSPPRPWDIGMDEDHPGQLYIISEDNRWFSWAWWGRAGFQILVDLENGQIQKSTVSRFLFSF